MLKDIRSAKDLKNLDMRQLEALAGEIRAEIIDTVSRRGGHLASNLGVVELTVALDYVFSGENDRLIFDVGHQVYAHKLITGRQDRFSSLRSSGGLSGFSSMAEDPRDAFTAGHASTSISAALGYCRARDLKGEKGAVVAVIGDGSLTGGMSYEAFNDAGQSKTGLIVILNDNDMSISRNVGAISSHLTAMRQAHFYRNLKLGTQSLLESIPFVGKALYNFISHIKDMLKALVIEDNIFDAMGFKYVGPLDGHDINQLARILKRARDVEEPVLIHVVTRKGKGYRPAEEHPERFHGATPFDVETGEPREPSEAGYGKIAAEILADIAEKRSEICTVTAAMPTGTGLCAFADRHPERFFDVGIAEEHAVTMAAGLAASGMKPYVAIYSTFLQRAYDQISNDICINRLPVTLLIDRAGLVGADGATHNGILDLSYLRSIPNMTIAAPRDVRALRRLMEFSMDFKAPLAIRYPRDAVDLGVNFEKTELIIPGRWEKLVEGDITMIAVGRMVEIALHAAMMLEQQGVSAGVIDAMFIKPLDTRMLSELAKRRGAIVTLEENTLMGGFGEAVLGELNRMGADCKVLMLGVPDKYVTHADIDEQLERCGLDAESIVRSIRRYIGK
jgi:1-deoxy-D-xylulose-5-phosphate synthase